jgi:chaperonin GroEL
MITRLISSTSETAIVEKPAEAADDHGHGHHH